MTPEPRSSYDHIEITPYSAAVGATVHNIDLAEPQSPEIIAEIKAAHGEFGVLFFRDQSLTPEQHEAFAEQVGGINVNRFFTPVKGHPRIAEVRKEPDQKTNIGGSWHTDHSYDLEPALGSILYAIDVPAGGGDTLFASMYAAHDTLSDGLKKTLSGMRAVHSSRHVFGPNARAAAAMGTGSPDTNTRLGNAELATQDSVHPVLITHPVTGRKALYVNADFTTHFEGWTTEESAPLLSYLYAHAARSEFTCRFGWAKGSVAFWDNRCTWHKALNDYDGERRLMHRITVAGTVLN